MDIKLPYVHPKKRKNGSLRYFFSRKGYPPKRLHGEPGSPGFLKAYYEAMEQPPILRKTVGTAEAGTLAALVDEYMASGKFRDNLAASTQRETTYVLRKIVATNGGMLVAQISRATVQRWMDGFVGKPGAANKWLRIFRILMKYAVALDYRKDNPCGQVDLMKQGEYRAWTGEEIAAFCKRWPLGTFEYLGFALALYTGQRRTDVAAMTFRHIVGNCVKVKPEKTKNSSGVMLEIPIHPALGQALAGIPPRPESTILTREDGAPMNPVTFGQRMADAILKAGLPDDCVLHGLRKSATAAMIDAGCSPHQAAAVTGHNTTRMIEHYAKQRDRTKLAKDAMRKWAGRKSAKKAVNSPP